MGCTFRGRYFFLLIAPHLSLATRERVHARADAFFFRSDGKQAHAYRPVSLSGSTIAISLGSPRSIRLDERDSRFRLAPRQFSNRRVTADLGASYSPSTPNSEAFFSFIETYYDRSSRFWRPSGEEETLTNSALLWKRWVASN